MSSTQCGTHKTLTQPPLHVSQPSLRQTEGTVSEDGFFFLSFTPRRRSFQTRSIVDDAFTAYFFSRHFSGGFALPAGCACASWAEAMRDGELMDPGLLMTYTRTDPAQLGVDALWWFRSCCTCGTYRHSRRLPAHTPTERIHEPTSAPDTAVIRTTRQSDHHASAHSITTSTATQPTRTKRSRYHLKKTEGSSVVRDGIDRLQAYELARVESRVDSLCRSSESCKFSVMDVLRRRFRKLWKKISHLHEFRN